jgi:hypothetical protein
MRNAILFVRALHAGAMHGSMVAYVRHAALRPGIGPRLGPSVYQPDSGWFSSEERALAYL